MNYVKFFEVLANESHVYGESISINHHTPYSVLEKIYNEYKNKYTNIISHLASNPKTPQYILRELAGSKDRGIKSEVAKNPNSPSDVLYLLEKDKDKSSFYYKTFEFDIIKNPNCPEDLFNKVLKNHPDNDFVKEYIANNPSCPRRLLKKFAKEESDLSILWGVAENKNSTEKELRIIFQKSHNSKYTFGHILNNPNCTPDLISDMYVLTTDHSTLFSIVLDPNCPTYILEESITSDDRDIRYQALSNKNFPIEDYWNDPEKRKKLDLYDLAVCKRCPANILVELSSHDYPEKIRKAAIRNENYPVDLLEGLSSVIESDSIRQTVAYKSNCPWNIIEGLIDEGVVSPNYYLNRPEFPADSLINYINTGYDKSIAENPNCPPYVLEKLVDTIRNKELISRILNNPNCNLEIVNKIMSSDNYDIRNYFITQKVTSYGEEPLTVFYNELVSHLDKEELTYYKIQEIHYKISSDDCPTWFINKIRKRKDIYERLNEEDKKKIDSVINSKENITEEAKNIFSPKTKPNNYVDIDFLSNKIDYVVTNNKEDQTDFARTTNNSGAKVVFYCNHPEYVEEIIDKNKTDEFAYGEYIKSSLDETEIDTIQELYDNKLLKSTGKEYRILGNYGRVKYFKEYEFNGCKFANHKKEWYRVEPIYWKYDKENKRFICKYDLLSVGPILENKEKMLNKFFKQDIITTSIKVDKKGIVDAFTRQLEKQKEESSNKKFKDIKSQVEFEDKKEKLRKEEIEKLKKTKLQMFQKISDIDERLKELEYEEYYEETGNRKSVDLSELIITVDDHLEFNSQYVKYLKYIDLSTINEMPNIKVSGIDFSETNIKLDPQTVYKKDLSYSKFSDFNISFKSFEGCILDGTDLSDDKNCVDFDKAASTNSDTKLPERNKGMKLYNIMGREE